MQQIFIPSKVRKTWIWLFSRKDDFEGKTTYPSWKYFWTKNPTIAHTTSQWCVFNNYSLDKHRHQIWQWFHIQKIKWKLNYKREFCHNLPQKVENWHLSSFWWISFKINNLRNPCSFEKKKSLFIFEKIIQRHIVNSKFQELHFCFSDYFWFQKFWRCTLTFVFFLMNKN